MTREEHHLLCLGVLAKIGQQKGIKYHDLDAIREAIESAESLGMPVSVKLYDQGRGICTHSRQ